MAATVESLLAAGIDADTARNIAPFVAPDHGQKHVAMLAKLAAAERQAATNLFGADSPLGVEHLRVLGKIDTARKAPGLTQLGGKSVLPLVQALLAGGYVVELAGSKYERAVKQAA